MITKEDVRNAKTPEDRARPLGQLELELDQREEERQSRQRRIKKKLDAAEAPPHESLRALTLDELFKRPAPSYLIDQWLPERALCELVGPPETLKSFFACHAGLAISSQEKDFFGYPVVKHGPVLYIAAEGGGAFKFRVRAWCNEHNVDHEEIPFRVIPLPIDLRNIVYQQELKAIIEELRPVLIIVDTLSRCTPGADENSARDMGEVSFFCTEIQEVSGAAVVLIHHPPKADPKGPGRGSTTILGAADTELRTAALGPTRADGRRVITVTCTKQKDDLKPEPLKLAADAVNVYNELGGKLCHDSGRPITTLLLRLATTEDVVSSQARLPTTSLEDKILAFLREHPGASSSEVKSGVSKQAQKALDTLQALQDSGRVKLDRVKSGKAWKHIYNIVESKEEEEEEDDDRDL